MKRMLADVLREASSREHEFIVSIGANARNSLYPSPRC